MLVRSILLCRFARGMLEQAAVRCNNFQTLVRKSNQLLDQAVLLSLTSVGMYHSGNLVEQCRGLL